MAYPAQRATIAEAAASVIRAASLRQGKQFEISFRCEWDEDAQQITAATPVFRGNCATTMYLSHQYTFGDMALHTHPSGQLEPSDPDLESAAAAATRGVGFAICDPSGDELFVVTTPRDVAGRKQKLHPSAQAWHSKKRSRRFSLFGYHFELSVYPPYPASP